MHWARRSNEPARAPREGKKAACPDLRWYTRDDIITGANFDPNPTMASFYPQTNFSVAPTAPVPQHGLIDAVSITSVIPGLFCSAAIDATVTNIGPDYNLTLISFDPPVALLGHSVSVAVTVTNIGNQNATNVTDTTLTAALGGEGCTPVSLPLQPLDAGESATQLAFTCPCVTPGVHDVTAKANAYQSQFETNYNNNVKTSSYFCKTVVQLTCADFV